MIPVDEPVDDYLRGLRHANGPVRIRAARALAKLASPPRDAFAPLVAAVDDSEQGVREAAVQALGAYGQDVLPTLAGFLDHSDKYVRRNAVWAIGKFGPAARLALPGLCNALRDGDPRTAAGAAQALGSMGAVAGPAVTSLVDAMRGTNVVLCRLAAKSLSQIGAPALEPLVANLRHHDPFVRAEAALALGWMGEPAGVAVSELVQLVEAYRPKVLECPQPMYSGGASGTVTPPAPPPMTAHTSEESARVNAIQALGRIGAGAASALMLLREIAAHEQDPFRTAAQQAIAAIAAT